MGHGAGAVAASLYALTRQRDLAGLICEIIALDLPASATLFGCARALALIAPATRPTTAGTDRCRIDSRPQPAEVIARTTVAAAAHPARLGGHCDVRRPEANTCMNVQHHLTRHCKSSRVITDLINDQGHEQVMERILQWIEDRLNPEHRNQIGIAYINADT